MFRHRQWAARSALLAGTGIGLLAFALGLVIDPTERRAAAQDSQAVQDAVKYLQSMPFDRATPIKDKQGKQIGWSLAGSQLSEAEFQKILPALVGSKQLSFDSYLFPDNVWKMIGKLNSLEELDFISVRMTPPILKELSALPKLQTLNIKSPGIDEQTLPSFTAFKQLRVLKLIGADVSDEGFRKLQAAMPNCQVSRK